MRGTIYPVWAAALCGMLWLGGCDKERSSKNGVAVGAMKCGAGKCGSGMMGGNSALVKKKRNILSQMRTGDPRRDCVLDALTTKALYDCVRDPKTGRLSRTCGSGKATLPAKRPAMKCAAGKCGGGM